MGPQHWRTSASCAAVSTSWGHNTGFQDSISWECWVQGKWVLIHHFWLRLHLNYLNIKHIIYLVDTIFWRKWENPSHQVIIIKLSRGKLSKHRSATETNLNLTVGDEQCSAQCDWWGVQSKGMQDSWGPGSFQQWATHRLNEVHGACIFMAFMSGECQIWESGWQKHIDDSHISSWRTGLLEHHFPSKHGMKVRLIENGLLFVSWVSVVMWWRQL